MIRRTPDRRGAAAVEFAVVSFIFLMMLAGLIELGRGLMTSYVLLNAARQGARAAVPVGRSNQAIVDAANAALARGTIQKANITIQVNGKVADARTAESGDRITVAVSVPVRSVTWVPVPRFLTGNISADYSFRRE